MPAASKIQRLRRRYTRALSPWDRLDVLEGRVGLLEEQGSKPPASQARTWMMIEKGLAPLLVGAVLLWLSFAVKDSVDLALKRGQLGVASAKEMQEMLVKMREQESNRAEIEAAAMTVATYGEFAIGPLVAELGGSPLRSVAAEKALVTLGRSWREELCASLTDVVNNRTQLYSWRHHLGAIRLLGRLSCVEAKIALLGYQKVVAGLSTLERAVGEEPPVGNDELVQLKREVGEALRRLGS